MNIPRALASLLSVAALAACHSPSIVDPVAQAPAASASLANVESRIMRLHDFRLQSGVVLKDVDIAYETYGTLAAGARNAILVTHGNTSSHHAAGRYAAGKAPPGVPESQAGWWDAIIGPGKAIDTAKYFVVSSNMLGGSYGSTSPRSPDPATGKPWGPDFPAITLTDMAAAQRALLERLGVKHLVAVAGPSYGGFLAFEWAVTYPEMIEGAVVVVSSPTGGANPRAVGNIERALAKDPHWNGGRYYDRGGITAAMTDLRVATLKAYGIERTLLEKFPDPEAREAQIRRQAAAWAGHFDGNSLLVQRRAMEFRDHAKAFGRVRAKVLYVLSATDKLFPPSIAPGVMAQLRAAGVDATYVEIASEKGHSGGTGDAAMFAAPLRRFLASLPAA